MIPLMIRHSGAKFRCLGYAFDHKQYRELDLVVWLYYSIKDHVPNNNTIHPSYQHQNSFSAVIFINTDSKILLLLDLILTKTTSRSVGCVVNNVIVLRNGSRLVHSKSFDIPYAYAQVVGSLQFLAVAKVFKSLINNKTHPGKVNCKGLLLIKKTIITFKDNVGQLDLAYLTVEFCEL